MQSNAIIKFSEDTDSYNYNLYIYAKNGNSKSVESTGNIINAKESNNNDLELIHTLIIIIVVIMCANCFYKLYKLHNKCIKNKFMSQANDLDNI